METLRSQHYETENANKENSSEFKFITKLGQSIQKLKENLKKFISAPEEEGSGLKEVPIEDDVQALVREFIEATDDLKDEYGLYSSSSGDSTPENHIIIPNQPILTQGINEMKKYVESNNHKDTGSYVGGINRILDQMLAEEPVETAQDTEGGKGEEYKFPGVEALQAALAEVVAEIPQQPNSATEGGKLARIEGEIHPDEGELETLDNSVEIEQLKQEARQAIQRYKEFADRHPPNLRTKSVQAAYRQLEKVSWDRVRELAYKLGGNISQELPQLRNILESHRDLKDSKDAKEYFLQKQKILVNEKGNITHIVDDEGNEFELNRPRTFEEIFNQSRPVHILYSTNEEGKKIGYIIKGLNLNTPDWIEGVLSDKEYLEPVIVDETVQPATPITEAVGPQEDNPDFPPPLNLTTPPWAVAPPENNPEAYADYDWKEDTEVDGPEQIESNPANRAENIITIDVEAEEVAEPKQSEERETTLQGSNPSGNTPENNTETTLQGSNSSGNTPENSTETTPQVSLDDLRLDYARAEEAWNRKRGDEQLKDTFISAREAYNTELERVLKLQVAKGQADTISQMFKKEVIDLRDSRTTQSQELQGKWEKRFNNAKEKFLGWATKNKTRWMLANMGLFAAGALLSSIGVGIPVTGALEMTRRSLGSVMAGVGSRNTLVGLMEDRDIKINKFGLNINFQAEVPKIVKESISEEDKIKAVSEDVLKERLGTLEAYYRLNGGKFTNDNQQQAYEKVLTELARRVQENVIDAENPNLSTQPSTNEQSENEKQNPSTEFVESDKQKLETDRYTSELLNTISDKRIAELDKFRRKRQIANVVGFATTGVLGGLLLNDMLKPGGIESANNGVSTTQEVQSTGDDTTSAEYGPKPQTSPTQSETISTDVSTQQAKELSRDVSRLDSGETIWGEITKQLGENASQSEIQQAVENYLQSELGQESLYKLAQQTEGGREFLARWSIDNAGEMARLELKDLYEVSKYLGEGELEGLTKLSLDNLDALSPAEYTAPSPLESPVNTSQFTKSLSEAIGANNLTDSQIGSVLEAYADTDQGRKSLYELIITSKANNPAISEILDRYNITYEAQLSDLPADQLNILAQKVGVENLNQLPGFKLNEIILSKFEDAPYMVDLARGTRPLDVVQRYIANELGNLPYDSNLGKQVLDTYVQTDAGKQWLYDAIVSNPNPNNQNVQSFREYLSYKGIKSAEDFKALFNWAEFSRNSNIPTSGFWNQIRLPNRNILQPLSTFLQPSKMIGIKDAVRQVLTG